jgi:hypothetical protein
LRRLPREVQSYCQMETLVSLIRLARTKKRMSPTNMAVQTLRNKTNRTVLECANWGLVSVSLARDMIQGPKALLLEHSNLVALIYCNGSSGNQWAFHHDDTCGKHCPSYNNWQQAIQKLPKEPQGLCRSRSLVRNLYQFDQFYADPHPTH